jgi:hypothetical protein
VKLRTDNRARLYGRDLLKPNTDYQAQQEGNRIVLVELVPAEDVPIVKPVRTKEGFLMLRQKLDRKKVAAAIRADRDAQ